MKLLRILFFILLCHTPGFAQKDGLFVLSIGVENYKDTCLNFNYCADDARNVDDAFRNQTDLYDLVKVKVLVEGQTTRSAVCRELERIAGEVTTNMNNSPSAETNGFLSAAAWEKAKSDNNVSAYEDFLKHCPKSAYAKLARLKLDFLKPAAPETLTDSLAGTFVLVKGGSFFMGSEDGEGDEKPVHHVSLGDYYLGKYEITVAQFKTFIDDTGYPTDAETDDGSNFWNGSSWEKKSEVDWRCDALGNRRPSSEYNHPVIHVSWNDAKAYSDWLTRKTGKTYRLPTEAEWEYAAGNGGRHTKYSWGNRDNVGKRRGNVAVETAKRTFFSWAIFKGSTDRYVYSAPVGSFDANDFGLYDMSGNVWEWCSDWYGSYDFGSQTNPIGPGDGSGRVLRGGSWDDYPQFCRVANRNGISPGSRYAFFGFRLAKAVSF